MWEIIIFAYANIVYYLLTYIFKIKVCSIKGFIISTIAFVAIYTIKLIVLKCSN